MVVDPPRYICLWHVRECSLWITSSPTQVIDSCQSERTQVKER
ncbi:hypothetical protein SJ05684_c01920 [Sinorhizobium sojae CCBAU 05684]|uniref:Uncharacterized protein n=1 Tax=Sinorhizobium sojae CCBAU 05684 TaxID=716928 RepID=A0A249P7E8_9HYPH|nr:hypothetical protein SJ05684_c01920 [Sinorhizobium sojae CCBAU 05684]